MITREPCRACGKDNWENVADSYYKCLTEGCNMKVRILEEPTDKSMVVKEDNMGELK